MKAALPALVLLALPAPALAQAYQCQAPASIELPRAVRPDGPAVRTAVGGYTLAISWSPEFCRGRAATDPDNLQCNGAIGRFGFVLHGLWPEARRGRPPQWCALTPRPSAEELKANLCMTPVPWLLEHEWAKHGSCMARTPGAYFRSASILWNSIRLPDADRLSRQEFLTAGDLRKAFAALNPALPRNAIGIRSGNGGWLREVHLCYGKNFMPSACEPRALGPRDNVPLKIWRGL